MVKVFRDLLEAKRLDAIVVSTLVNIRYYSGFTGSSALLLVTKSGMRLITDPRYAIQAAQEAKCPVKIVKGRLIEQVAKVLKAKARIGFENSRASYALSTGLRKIGALVSIDGALESPRWLKTADEILAIRASVNLNSKALAQALRRFKMGMSEKDMAAEIDYRMRKLGAERPAFDTIVASGAHSALPHASPRDARIEEGGYLLIDMGASLNGYMSDMTRTFGVGKMPRESKRIYDAVLEAQESAIAAVKPGALAGGVHAAAVRTLKVHKLDKLFTHSTGHGLGLEIHESPGLRKGDETVLKAGMAITIEPGVYKAGFGGVRIEDTVLVTESGVEILTPTPKGWTILV